MAAAALGRREWMVRVAKAVGAVLVVQKPARLTANGARAIAAVMLRKGRAVAGVVGHREVLAAGHLDG